ncbi:nuclear transport factor 2 family protein [Streptomyces violascens]|uniref:nuclear transport factor 2 family protein n=1 Tax=Streptomyces violascens TaxID=67381 RepID=UPI0036462125
MLLETDPAVVAAEAVVERQMQAYNRQALEEFLACYADAAELLIDGVPTASGKNALREIYARQFAELPLKASSLARIGQAEWIVDHERIEVEGVPVLSMLALYRVREGLIDQVQFFGQRARP